MKKSTLIIVLIALIINSFAQTTVNNSDIKSSSLQIFQDADRNIYFNVSEEGVAKPIIWGLDLAWLDPVNIRRGTAYMGKENVDIIRSSFMPTDPLSNGALSGTALTNTNLRISYINTYLDAHTKVVLNSDHPSVNQFFYGNANNWSDLIQITAQMHQDAGREVVSVSPFNEPDYSPTGQGTIDHFYAIAKELQSRAFFENIRISGGNTLNNDVALEWYNTLKSQLDEGNTHQLAGTFDTYATFYEAVRANGHHATNDELHNVMEAMVGVEYGLQTGIWWGTAERARGEFVKASKGVRLGYAEHRPNWTAASVYKHPNGKVQGFVGASERQAVTTTYQFVSEDRDVFFDGHGPQRSYLVEIPGGTGYQQDQSNAEKVVNITWGDDIQPVIDGKYILVNRNSGKILEPANSSSSNGANIQQNSFNGSSAQQWNVKPISARNGGDFSYFNIKGVVSNKFLDMTNSSLKNGGNAIQWEEGSWWAGGQALNQLWYFEYNEDGWFYIRNKFSNKCLEVANASTGNGANIQQWDWDGGKNQQWRFVPVDATPELNAPESPSGLLASANAQSIKLSWNANPESDLAGYTIVRSESSEGPYNTIARKVVTTSFIDYKITTNKTYFYKIKAVDEAINSSDFTRAVSAKASGAESLTAHYNFEMSTQDESVNLNHSVGSSSIDYVDGQIDDHAISFNGEDAFLKLPTNIANKEEMSIAFWVNWQRAVLGLHVFNFNKNENEYLYFTPVNSNSKMEFTMKNESNEIELNAPLLPFKKWTHIAITISDSEIVMYQNGEKVASHSSEGISPNSIQPIFNYIGRSNDHTKPFFKGYLDDFRIYNYAISETKVGQLAGISGKKQINSSSELILSPVPANNVIKVSVLGNHSDELATVNIFSINGKAIKEIKTKKTSFEMNISDFPNGLYTLKYATSKSVIIKKLNIKH